MKSLIVGVRLFAFRRVCTLSSALAISSARFAASSALRIRLGFGALLLIAFAVAFVAVRLDVLFMFTPAQKNGPGISRAQKRAALTP